MATVPNGYPINGGDFPAHNLAVTDIPAFTAVVFDTTGPTYDQCMTVKIPAAAGSVQGPAGITQEIIYAGKQGRVRRYGASKATAHGTVVIGEFVQISSTAAHEGQVKTAGAAIATLGQCIYGGTDATEIMIDLHPGFTAA